MSKCRNSVFCVRFLVFFLFGTICGIWFYRCLAELETGWLEPYASGLETACGRSLLLAVFRPLILGFLCCLHPFGWAAVPLLIGARGFLTAYSACAVLRVGLPAGPVILRGLVILPFFYRLCCRAWYKRYGEAVVLEREKRYARKQIWFMF